MGSEGMSWATNIYQKFETMCMESLEVEEALYEGTVKYVENQVEKVSGSVKQFCSDMMQDFLPPSSVHPVEVVGGDEVISDSTAVQESSLAGCSDANNTSPGCSTVLLENARSESCATKSKKVGMIRRPIGIKRISPDNRALKVSCPTNPGDVNVVASLDFIAGRDIEEVVNARARASLEPYASENPLSVESATEEKDDSECTISGSGLPAKDCIDMELIEKDEVCEPKVETFKPVENSNLEETRVTVEGNEHFLVKGIKKDKSFKRKIREVFSSKFGSRKQDQSLSQFNDLGVKNNTGSGIPHLKMDHDSKIVPLPDSFESDWELL